MKQLPRPWLICFGPFITPSDAREELHTIAFGMTRKQFVDKIWALRDEVYEPVAKSSAAWPFVEVLNKKLATVTRLPAKAGAK